MRFTAEHHFDGSPAEVAALLVDPDFSVALQLPDLGTPEVLDHRPQVAPEGGMLRLRYEFTGSLDPIAERLLGGGRLAWIQEVRLQPAGDAGSLRFGAERDPGKLHGDAAFTLTAATDAEGGRSTTRRIEGSLSVRVPLIGAAAERRILPGLLGRLDLEAAALNERLG